LKIKERKKRRETEEEDKKEAKECTKTKERGDSTKKRKE
jgi:hypothetical protein